MEDALSEQQVAVKFGCQQNACRIGKTKLLETNKCVRLLKKFEMAINLKSKKHAKYTVLRMSFSKRT